MYRLFSCMMLFIVVVTGCAWPVATPAASLENDATQATHVIAHARGETAVPVNPLRIVTLDNGSLDNLLALGVTPVGAASLNPASPNPYPEYLRAQLANVEDIGSITEPNLELIVALQPDLILGNNDHHTEIYDQLAAIAPTVYSETAGATWKANLRLVATALGKAAAAETILQAYDARQAAFREAMGDQLAANEVSLLRSRADHVRVYLPGTFPGTVIADAGLLRPASQQAEGFALEFSLENISDMDGDVIFWAERTPSDFFSTTLLQSPLWQQLEAVQQGRVYEVSHEVWISGLGVQAANLIIDDLTRDLLGQEPVAAAPMPAPADPNACRTIVHDMGETAVCGTPTKVVVLGPHMLDLLLSLGLQAAGFAETSQINEAEFGKPVGAIAYLGPYVTAMPINVGSREEPNLEVLTLLKPDLILSELRDESQLALLQQIAPTLAYRGNRAAEWQRTIVPIATALNIPAEADRVIDEYEAFLAVKRAELAPIIAAHPRLIFMPRNQDGRITIFTPASWAGDLLVNLGFDLVYVADGEEVDTEASVEIMPTFSTDTIIVGASGTTTPAIAQEMWTSNAVLTALPASQAGRVYFVDYQLWSRVRGPLAARLVTEALIGLFAQP